MVMNLFANAGHASPIPGSGRSPGKGNDNLLQYSCVGIPIEELGRQCPWGHKTVKHDIATEQQQFITCNRWEIMDV